MTNHLHHQPLAFLISVIISSLKWTFNPHPSFLCPLLHITLFIMFPFHSINTFSHLRLILCQFFFNTTSSSLSSLLSPINQSLFPSSANSSSPFFFTSVTHSSTSFIPPFCFYSSLISLSMFPSLPPSSRNPSVIIFLLLSLHQHPSTPPSLHVLFLFHLSFALTLFPPSICSTIFPVIPPS